MAVMRLIPACKSYLWGGERLKQNYGKHYGVDPLAETWELSCHPDGESRLYIGEEKSVLLSQWLKENPGAMGSIPSQFPQFPVLIKLIDAAKPLSIQVHPDDDYAFAHEHQYGKTEMWYVIEATPGAFLYHGFQHKISVEEFEERIRNQTLTEVLRTVPVKPGDVFFIAAGTIHAIGAGMVIAEIQQSSNVTYRVYDYGRVGTDGKQRQLHISQALAVTNRTPPLVSQSFGSHLAFCRYFTVDQIRLNGASIIQTDGSTFHCLMCIKGEAAVQDAQGTLVLHAGDCVFVPADYRGGALQGNALLLDTYLEWIS